MYEPTPELRQALAAAAQQFGVSVDAARSVLEALAAGGGRMAQFNHPDLGGMGQWSQGGMTQVGDMFNQALKERVSALCATLAGQLQGLADGPLAASAPATPAQAAAAPSAPAPAWDAGQSSQPDLAGEAKPGRPAMDDPLAIIERLAGLRQKGILTEDEFALKKTELLGRL